MRKNKHPNFFNKTSDCKVATIEESFFRKIQLWGKWNHPARGLRKLIQEDTLMAQKSIEATMIEDRSMTKTRRALFTAYLVNLVTFMDSLIQLVDATHR